MSTLRKGKIIAVKSPLIQVMLVGGHKFWTERKTGMDIHDFVWVAWDYTQDKPAQVLTRSEMEELTRSTEHGVSPLPAVEDEGPEAKNEYDSEDTNFERMEVDIEQSEYDDESFSDPKVDVSEEYEVRSFSDPCV